MYRKKLVLSLAVLMTLSAACGQEESIQDDDQEVIESESDAESEEDSEAKDDDKAKDEGKDKAEDKENDEAEKDDEGAEDDAEDSGAALEFVTGNGKATFDDDFTWDLTHLDEPDTYEEKSSLDFEDGFTLNELTDDLWDYIFSISATDEDTDEGSYSLSYAEIDLGADNHQGYLIDYDHGNWCHFNFLVTDISGEAKITFASDEGGRWETSFYDNGYVTQFGSGGATYYGGFEGAFDSKGQFFEFASYSDSFIGSPVYFEDDLGGVVNSWVKDMEDEYGDELSNDLVFEELTTGEDTYYGYMYSDDFSDEDIDQLKEAVSDAGYDFYDEDGLKEIVEDYKTANGFEGFEKGDDVKWIDIVSDSGDTDESEDSDEEEVSVSYQDFLDGEATAIADVDYDFYSVDDLDNPLASFAKGDEISIDDILELKYFEDNDYSEYEHHYTYINEGTDAEMLVIQCPSSSYTDENCALMFFLIEDDGIHLTEVLDNLQDEYTSIYLGKGGLYSTKAFPLGMSSSELVVCETGAIDDDGHYQELFTEKVMSGEWLEDDEVVGDIYSEAYADSNALVYVDVLSLDGEEYYVLQSDGSDADADDTFLSLCLDEGLNALSMDDMIPLLEDYAEDQGFELDLKHLDKNIVKFEKL